jgi:hypothetical protein
MNQGVLTIGITTFERRTLVEALARSLAQVDRLDQVRVLVMDDCSREFDVSFLQTLFPGADVVRARRNSGGADQAMHRLFEYFVQNGSDYLLNLDSDLLPSRRLVDRCTAIIRSDRPTEQPCLYSVFNTPTHKAGRVDGQFLIKPTIGAAGTLWHHALLADVLAHVPVSRSFDWDWCAYLSCRGVPIRVTPTSYLQHIGGVGHNTPSLVKMDHGLEFDDYHGNNLTVFLDQTREGLIQAISEQKARLDKQSEAIVQLSQVVQSQAKLLNDVISEVCTSRPLS